MTPPPAPPPRITASFPSIEALRAALRSAGHDTEMVVEGPIDAAIQIGAVLHVSVEVVGHEGVLLPAMAVWRRPTARGGLAAATGLRLDRRSAERLRDLRPSRPSEDDVRDVVAWKSRKSTF